MGGAKFATFVGLASAAAVAARAALAAALPPPGAGAPVGGGAPHSWLRSGLASGPYHVVFGLLPIFALYVPALSPHFFKLGPVPFSDKATTYSLAAALALCTGARSLLAAGAALAFGLAYTLPGPGRGLQAVRLPRAAVDAVWAVAGPLLGGDPADADLTAGGAAAAAGGRAGSPRGAGGADDDDGSDGGDGAGGAGGAGGGGAGADEGEPLGPEPSDEAVARVAAMGFPPAAVRDALRRSFGDEAAAVGRLVGT